jgi:propanediol dehydratase small subunit
MSTYRTVTVKPTLSWNKVRLTPRMSSNQIRATAQVSTKVQVNNTSDYTLLRNKPQIESVELLGNKSFSDLGLTAISNKRLEEIMKF